MGYRPDMHYRLDICHAFPGWSSGEDPEPLLKELCERLAKEFTCHVTLRGTDTYTIVEHEGDVTHELLEAGVSEEHITMALRCFTDGYGEPILQLGFGQRASESR